MGGLALRTWWRFVVGWAMGGKYLAPYVPTNEFIVAQMLKLASLTHSDRLFDVGCGDGRAVPPPPPPPPPPLLLFLFMKKLIFLFRYLSTAVE